MQLSAISPLSPVSAATECVGASNDIVKSYVALFHCGCQWLGDVYMYMVGIEIIRSEQDLTQGLRSDFATLKQTS